MTRPDNTRAGTVETLTAEVRALVIGNRQVTLSVLGQLDTVHPEDIEPMGRVRPRYAVSGEIHVVGKVPDHTWRHPDGTPLTAREIIQHQTVGNQDPKLFEARVAQLEERLSEPDPRPAGTLVTSWLPAEGFPRHPARSGVSHHVACWDIDHRPPAAPRLTCPICVEGSEIEDELNAVLTEWRRLPLLVMAGLR